MKKFTFTAIFFLAGCSLLPAPQINTISFHGSAEIAATPDVATFSFTARSEDKTTILAQQRTAEKTNSALEVLKKNKIESKDIQTENYRTNPQYSYQNFPCQKNICPPSKKVLEGFEATQTISLKLRDISKSGEILTALAALDISEVTGPNLSIENPEKLRSQAQAQAISKAKEKAKTTAENLGIKLRKIISFSEDQPDFRMPRPMMMSARAATFDGMEKVAPRLEAGEEKIISSVTITYEIE